MTIKTSTKDSIPNYEEVENLGVVMANVLYKHSAFSNTSINLTGLFKGIKPIYKDLHTCRFEAQSKAIMEAERLGANALVGIRYETSHIAPNYIELLCFGTAIQVRELSKT